MKLVAVLLIAVVAALILLLVWELMTNGFGRLASSVTSKRQSRRGWMVAPRTLPDGWRQIFLTCPGEPDFLLFDEKTTTEIGRSSVARARQIPMTWDEALVEAEVQANEFNRLRSQGRKELK